MGLQPTPHLASIERTQPGTVDIVLVVAYSPGGTACKIVFWAPKLEQWYPDIYTEKVSALREPPTPVADPSIRVAARTKYMGMLPLYPEGTALPPSR